MGKRAKKLDKSADPAVVAFGKVLRAARNAHRHSQTQLAEFTGIDQSRISKYERGEVAMGIDEALKIADLYQIDLGLLTPRSKRERKSG